VPKKKIKVKPVIKALKEIRVEQKKATPVFQKSRFSKLVREITGTVTKQEYRWKSDALDALQYASKDYLIKMFGGA
jgi:histone H3/H4